MEQFWVISIVLIGAYLVGSIPTAIIVSKKIKHIDIRTVGDANMGARNIFHQVSPGFGFIVALIDIAKGALPVLIAHIIGLSFGWQILTAALTILGHDFPVFANFKGGQGTAASCGTMLVLFPIPTLIGLGVFIVMFFIVKNFSISCGTGGGVIALILAFSQQWALLTYFVSIALFVLLKTIVDGRRRRAILR